MIQLKQNYCLRWLNIQHLRKCIIGVFILLSRFWLIVFGFSTGVHFDGWWTVCIYLNTWILSWLPALTEFGMNGAGMMSMSSTGSASFFSMDGSGKQHVLLCIPNVPFYVITWILLLYSLSLVLCLFSPLSKYLLKLTSNWGFSPKKKKSIILFYIGTCLDWIIKYYFLTFEN